MAEEANNSTTTWYVRKDNKVMGPYPARLIGRFLILGRIKLDTEVSADNQRWIAVGKIKFLIPKEILEANTEKGQKQLQAARQREDERRTDRRQESPEQSATQDVQGGGERRRSDRRSTEEVAMKMHRRLREDLLHQQAVSKKFSRWGAGTLVLAVGGVLVAFLVLEPRKIENESDCAAPPGKGVDWSYCNKQSEALAGRMLEQAILKNVRFDNANLAQARLGHSDLSYGSLNRSELIEADLQNATLVGASLRGANLFNANLNGANFSYADLQGATIDNAAMEGAVFDHAIWVDGRKCLVGSVGGCLLGKPSQQ